MGMRYKIKLPNKRAFEEAESLARSATRVYTVSARRFSLSTDEVPENVKKKIESIGGKIVEDRAYDLEATR